MVLERFQTTVREYIRFAEQFPIDFSETLSCQFSDSTYVSAQTRLMLLRKYTRSGRGNLYLFDIATKAIHRFPEHLDYLSEFQSRFQKSCVQSLNHVLADGTERTLDESIDDTMYGLYLHADEERIQRITKDNELLRLYCTVTELYNFFKANGVSCIEKAQHLRAPVIHLESKDSNTRNVTGSPF